MASLQLPLLNQCHSHPDLPSIIVQRPLHSWRRTHEPVTKSASTRVSGTPAAPVRQRRAHSKRAMPRLRPDPPNIHPPRWLPVNTGGFHLKSSPNSKIPASAAPYAGAASRDGTNRTMCQKCARDIIVPPAIRPVSLKRSARTLSFATDLHAPSPAIEIVYQVISRSL